MAKQPPRCKKCDNPMTDADRFGPPAWECVDPACFNWDYMPMVTFPYFQAWLEIPPAVIAEYALPYIDNRLCYGKDSKTALLAIVALGDD